MNAPTATVVTPELQAALERITSTKACPTYLARACHALTGAHRNDSPMPGQMTVDDLLADADGQPTTSEGVSA